MVNMGVAVTSESFPEVRNIKNTRLDDSLFSKELAPHYMQLASKLANSELVPKCYRGKPQDLFLAWAMGYSMGMSPEQSMQCIAIINGRACMWGDEMLALCMTHKDFIDIIEETVLNGNSIIGYQCTVKRKNMTDHVYTFTVDMAKKAGLLSKPGTWSQYPERMLQLRARAFALRNRFPDALKGIKSREEVEDYIDVEYKSIDDKISRTEFLKKDLLTKGNLNVENISETAHVTCSMENQSDSQEADQINKSNTVDEFRKSENNSDAESHITNNTLPEKITLIHQLLEEKGFTNDRLLKALKYYEIDDIQSMTDDFADHFISQLNKS